MQQKSWLIALPLLLVGCSSASTPGASLTAAPAPKVGLGSIEVGIRWPAYAAQAIPYSSATLDLTLLQDTRTLATASIARPATSGTLDRVKAGSYVLLARTRRSDATKTVVAEATTSVDVHANRVASARLTLVPKFAPLLSSISPTQGPIGTTITLWGAFGNASYPIDKASYSVTVDGVAVPADPANNFILVTVPEGVGSTCSVSVSVDGISVPPDQVKEFSVVPAETPEP